MPKGCPVKNHIMALLGTRQIRMTPSDLEGALHQRMPDIQRRILRSIIKEMVKEGALVYTNHFSTTHLEMNFNRPVQVSERITLCPANCPSQETGQSICIKLLYGTSFGIGDHPTTRLCIQGLDAALTRYGESSSLINMTALDIGTGSAVLAMAAVALGVGHAMGIDIDPMACIEAKNNLTLNGMTDRITIRNKPLAEKETMVHDLILANLRPPTLKALFPVIEKISTRNALWVLSGFRPEEEKGVAARIPSKIADVIWRSQEREWSGMVLRRH